MPGRILIVDDNSDAAETLADLLRMMDYEVRVAGDGKAAMAALADYQPQLALLDIGLPGEDGYALAGRMRADPRMAAAKLIALSGYGQDKERSQATGAKFDAHLIKPVGADQLLDEVKKMIG